MGSRGRQKHQGPQLPAGPSQGRTWSGGHAEGRPPVLVAPARRPRAQQGEGCGGVVGTQEVHGRARQAKGGGSSPQGLHGLPEAEASSPSRKERAGRFGRGSSSARRSVPQDVLAAHAVGDPCWSRPPTPRR